MNTIIKNDKKNKIGIYIVMFVIILLFMLLPTATIFTNVTKDTGRLIIAFICVSLFMLLDNRLAVLFLILLIVSYYKNMKNELQEKFEESSLEIPISKLGQSKAEQEKNAQDRIIKLEITDTQKKLSDSLAEVNKEFNKNIQNVLYYQ